MVVRLVLDAERTRRSPSARSSSTHAAMSATPVPCMHVRCGSPDVLDVLQVDVEQRVRGGRGSPGRGRTPASPTSRCRSRRRARPSASPISVEHLLRASSRGGSRRRSGRRARAAPPRRRRRSCRSTSPMPPSRSTSSAFASLQADCELRAAWRRSSRRGSRRGGRAGRARRGRSRTCSRRRPAPVEVGEPEVDRVEPGRRDRLEQRRRGAPPYDVEGLEGGVRRGVERPPLVGGAVAELPRRRSSRS